MSVVEGKRGQGKLRVLLKSRELLEYTLQVTKSEDRFPKRSRWQYTYDIVMRARDVYTLIRMANAVPLSKDKPDDYKLRREYQLKAKAELEALLGLMDVAYLSHRINDVIEYWTGLAVETGALLTAWISSNEKRMKE